MPGDGELHAYLDAGDLRSAGTWLVRRYAHEVHGLCSAMVRDRSIAEDLAQDVFGRAFAALEGYRREASSRTWLLAIARNRCIDHLRAEGRTPFADTEPDEAPDDAPLTSELLSRRADVLRALGELDEAERALVILRYRHGLSYDELAGVFGLKAGTARMRVSRALGRMRATLVGAERLGAPAPRQAAAAPPPMPSGFAGAERLDEAAEELSEDRDEVVVPHAPPAAPSRRRTTSASRSRGGILSRVFGRESGGTPERDEASYPGGAPPPASPPRSTPAGDPLAAFLRSVDPAAPQGFRERLLALASRL